jgi:hypothetical protein
MKKYTIEELIERFGEENRNLITSSIKWLDSEESKWGLRVPIGRISFIKDLLRKKVKKCKK